jgi:diaminopimelate decarboxylase
MSDFWADLVARATSLRDTPFYLCAWQPVADAFEELSVLENRLPLRHWLSFKTHPVAPLIRKWRDFGQGVEVVSEYEFFAAIKEGMAGGDVLVNGVAKHSWLDRYPVRGIRVHFDSIQEIEALGKTARELEWHVGVRCHPSDEVDPDDRVFSGQFGMSRAELERAVELLKKASLVIESVHFYLRTNVPDVDCYERAIAETASLCRSLNLMPAAVDCGGGLPVPGDACYPERSKRNAVDMARLRRALLRVPELISSAKEVWMENGRFLTSRSAVLVIRVLDIKERDECRYVICDGGRTNHALVSDWEFHDVFTLPHRSGEPRLTTVCGPNCMMFDRLDRIPLPCDVSVGDIIVWTGAGAYHIPWETRFSRGLAAVLWCGDDGNISVARREETCAEWWNRWIAS